MQSAKLGLLVSLQMPSAKLRQEAELLQTCELELNHADDAEQRTWEQELNHADLPGAQHEGLYHGLELTVAQKRLQAETLRLQISAVNVAPRKLEQPKPRPAVSLLAPRLQPALERAESPGHTESLALLRRPNMEPDEKLANGVRQELTQLQWPSKYD
eukprot:gnl/TRDRNA2_/TRDRNA2_117186_c2_seq1.p2 gnl/TRDRNA2_/TRDRNA2_117186_c2~~gnl/TRDRNA2_/TRDRNA2_117186_c2_seq1.p2  ORF type:complete len:158 (+),score=32.32 gnl/TRDRNA2_/TRDRNA2_117186_c2_seq1:448-921(+)